MTLLDLTQPLRRSLGRLRRRARGLLALLGTGRALVFLVTALLAYFAADYLLRLPLGVRQVLLPSILLGFLVVAYRHLLRPLSSPLDDMTLGARVEAAFPALENRLCSSLAFAHAEEDPDNDDSRAMMRAVVEQTLAMTADLPFTRVAHNRVALRWGAGAIVLLVVALAGVVTRTDLATTFARRSLLLHDIDWPRRTTLLVAGMEPGVPRPVTRGRDVTLEVRARGSAPDRVSFAFWERADDGRSRETIDLTPSPDDRSLFAITLPVYTSYAFTVTGGDDDRAEIYLIEALTPPAVLSLELDCTYPAYLEREPETLRGGDQRLPEGTDVELRVRTNMPLERATVTLGAEEPSPLARAEADLYTARLRLEQDLRYSLRLVGGNGEENDPGADTYVLRAQRDQPPVLRVHTPGPHSERLPGGVLLAGFSVRDDHRVRDARLVLSVNGGAERPFVLGDSGNEAVRIEQAADQGPEYVLALATLDLARVRTDDGRPLAKGDNLELRLEATDSAGRSQVTRSPLRIDLLAEEDLVQALPARQQVLRESVERTAERADAAATELQAMRDARGVPDEFRRWAGRAQAAQARVVGDLNGVVARTRDMLNTYVFNRLDDPAAVEQILPDYARHLLEPTDRPDVPFRGTLYRTLHEARQERVIRAGGALGKLIEMADLAERLADDHAPAAYRALSRATSGVRQADEVDAAIDEARAEQDRVQAGLDRLRLLMREWMTYESVVRFFKAVRDREQSIVEELGGLPGKGG